MSNEAVKLIRRAYEANSRGEVATMLQYVDPDLKWTYLDPSLEDPEPQVCHGRHELEAALERQAERGLKAELEEVEAMGDRVMVVVRTPGLDMFRLRKAGDRNYAVFTVREGRIVARGSNSRRPRPRFSARPSNSWNLRISFAKAGRGRSREHGEGCSDHWPEPLRRCQDGVVLAHRYGLSGGGEAVRHDRDRRRGRPAPRGSGGVVALQPELGTIDISGHGLAGSKKFRNVKVNPKVAFVVDDIASIDPWRPRVVMVQGHAEALEGQASTFDGSDDAIIRIAPDKIVSWGLDEGTG